ncbi:hypothetical protein [Oricola indica]|uniref:hypothetical protein n=1 Tax=Oricola indica TaxID=2872591 RepID=UPI001CBCDAFD|nr:hypothetical protein [Oricola indica]
MHLSRKVEHMLDALGYAAWQRMEQRDEAIGADTVAAAKGMLANAALTLSEHERTLLQDAIESAAAPLPAEQGGAA